MKVDGLKIPTTNSPKLLRVSVHSFDSHTAATTTKVQSRNKILKSLTHTVHVARIIQSEGIINHAARHGYQRRYKPVRTPPSRLNLHRSRSRKDSKTIWISFNSKAGHWNVIHRENVNAFLNSLPVNDVLGIQVLLISDEEPGAPSTEPNNTGAIKIWISQSTYLHLTPTYPTLCPVCLFPLVQIHQTSTFPGFGEPLQQQQQQ